MSKRSELRRMQREAEKKKTTQIQANPVNVLYGSQAQVQKDFGLSVQELKVYLERMEAEIKKDMQAEYQEKLEKAEEYTFVANLLISIYAVKMSRKKHEHTKDLIQRMLDNFNAATEFVNRVGAKEAYRLAHRDLGITLQLDSEDMNKEFAFPGDNV